MSKARDSILLAAAIAVAIGVAAWLIPRMRALPRSAASPAAAPVRHRRPAVNLEFYWLKNVESRRNPSAKWEMLPPEQQPDGTEIFAFRNKVTNQIIKGDTLKGRAGILLNVVNAYDPVANAKGMKPLLTGRDLQPNCRVEMRPAANQPILNFRLTLRGGAIFANFTRRHVDDIVAVFLDGRILTAPNIREPITTGEGVIEGFASLDEAARVANALNSGT